MAKALDVNDNTPPDQKRQAQNPGDETAPRGTEAASTTQDKPAPSSAAASDKPVPRDAILHGKSFQVNEDTVHRHESETPDQPGGSRRG